MAPVSRVEAKSEASVQGVNTIRIQLLHVDPHKHLFGRVPRLGLPSSLTKYVLYDQTLRENENDNDVNKRSKVKF